MDIAKIEKLLQQCDLEELHTIEKNLVGLIKHLEGNDLENDEEGRKRRRDKRFGTNILATLRRITDVRPHERKEYSVTIQDISRNGMRLKVDTNFTPSRIIEVEFVGPGGKIKKTMLEVVRMRKMVNENGSWLEVGCRSINDEEVRRIRMQEEHASKMRSKIYEKTGIIIILVGPQLENVERLAIRIKSEGYQIRREEDPYLVRKIAESLSAQLAIFYHADRLLSDPAALRVVMDSPAKLAKLAIVENEKDRNELFQNGFDECLTVDNCDTFLFHSIERALVGHAVRHSAGGYMPTAAALIYSVDNTKVNMLKYQLENHEYNCQIINELSQTQELNPNEFDLVMVDFDQYRVEEFRQLRRQFSELPIVALCNEISLGQQAMAEGADNYLCMPPNKEDMRMILEGCMAKASTT